MLTIEYNTAVKENDKDLHKCYGVISRTYTDTHTQLTLEQHRFELQDFTYT